VSVSLASVFQVREVRVLLVSFISACFIFVSCLKCLGAVVFSMNIDICGLCFEYLVVAFVNSGGSWYSRPSERVSPRRD